MADTTAITETAQALFCSIADYVGYPRVSQVLDLKKYPTYNEFKSTNKKLILDSFKRVNAPGVSLDNIETILESKNKSESDWYKSSITIAVELLKVINSIDSDFAKIKSPSWQDIFYYRGGKEGNNVMSNIGILFSIANKKDKLFGDVNKWSSADIYFASDDAEKEIKKQIDLAKSNTGFNFINLNKFINALISSGDLLGVSLKKSPNSVSIKRINFTESENEKILKDIQFFNIKTDNPRDMEIFMSATKLPKIQIRHDPTSPGLSATETPVIKIEVIGKASRLGSLTSFGTANPSGIGLTDLWARVDPSSAGDIYRSFKSGVSKYQSSIAQLNIKYSKLVNKKDANKTGLSLKQAMKDTKCNDNIIKNVIKLRGEFDMDKMYGIKNFESIKKLKPSLYNAYKNERIYFSQIHIVNSYKKKIETFFKGVSPPIQKLRKDNIILEIFKYLSAMSPSSGRFIIAK
jgi:hypothetical protein